MEVCIDKLDHAISQVQLIADGYDPVTHQPAGENSILNNPELIREMFFIKDVLDEVRRNGGFIGKKPSKSARQDFPIEALQSFCYEDDKAITRFVEQLNANLDEVRYKKLSYKTICDWLKMNMYLEEQYDENSGKIVSVASERGNMIGIYSEDRTSSRGISYKLNLYTKEAQEFIVRNMEAILNGEVM